MSATAMPPRHPATDAPREIEVRIAHFSPGRMRLKVRREVLESPELRDAEHALRQIAGVEELRINKAARSILVCFDEDRVNLADMLEAMARAGVTIVVPPEEAGEEPRLTAGDLIVSVVRGANRQIGQLTSNFIDLRTIVPLGLAAFGVRQVLTGQRTSAPWYVLFWYAFETFYKFQRTSPQPD